MAEAASLDIYERDIVISELQRTLELVSVDEEQFRSRIPELNAHQRKFLKIQSKIERQLIKTKTFNRDEQLKIRNDFNDIYHTILMHANKLKRSDEEDRRRSSVFFQTNRHSCTSNKLPTLPLPSFSGAATDWQAYYDLFISLIHNNWSYTNVEKFRYLLLTLKDEPFNLIKSIAVTDENYQNALDILVSRYDNKRIISSKHLENILDIPSCTDRVSSLRILLNTYQENIKALETLQYPVNQWSFILLTILLRKIPISLRKRFELTLIHPSDIPDVSSLINFIEREITATELSCSSKINNNHFHNERNSTEFKIASSGTPPAPRASRASPSARAVSRNTYVAKVESAVESSKNSHPFSSSNKVCICCGEQHTLGKCSKFLNLSIQERNTFVKNKNACFNCLNVGHDIKKCNSNFVCRICYQRHNSLLHYNKHVSAVVSGGSERARDVSLPPTEETNSGGSLTLAANTQLRQLTHFNKETSITDTVCSNTVLLSTALVNVYVNKQYRGTARVMIDTGSQATFINENCVKRLQLTRKYINTSVFGIGENKPVRPRGMVSICLTPRNKDHPFVQVNALILNKLISKMPSVSLPHTNWEHINNLTLADPTFHIPQQVDMILGADLLSQILLQNIVTGAPGAPIAINSIFGYLLLGKLSFDSLTSRACRDGSRDVHACFSSFSDDMDLQRFWELESLPEQNIRSPEEILCENIFQSTCTREETGQYVVALPFKPHAQGLGESRDIALARFRKLEYRLERDPQLKLDYHACLQEYLDSNHMELVPNSSDFDGTYYIPHHCVIKDTSETSRVRVVFDAGCKTSNGVSLNDILLTGPKLHPDIIDVLLKFRLHKIAFTADIKQMYRYILIRESDRDFQRILWRSAPDQPICDYRLCTVTFGVNSSPYLALRTIQQLARDEAVNFPIGAQVLARDVFVDDVVSGECTEQSALILVQQLLNICKSAGFELRKWHSNSSALLEAVQPSLRHGERRDDVSIAGLDNDKSIKVLGLIWNPNLDNFSFCVKAAFQPCTKRTILSQIAKIYDPIGWLSPVTFYAKHLMQLLWISGVSWDDTPPTEIVDRWSVFLEQLSMLSDLSIPRHVCNYNFSFHLHGFADASENGYAACVYLRCTDEYGNIHTSLLLAKTRVASLNPRLTIPRLELMAALLVSRLIDKVIRVYNDRIKFKEIFAWSDSSIVLSWLRSSPHEWKTFVSNRTSEILSRVPASCWRHVPSQDNPADCASRGMLPEVFLQHNIWFSGPSWLQMEESAWPVNQNKFSTSEEKRNLPVVSVAVASTPPDDFQLFSRFSSLGKLVRVVALIFRFYNKCKKGKMLYPTYVTVQEYNTTLKLLIKLAQYSAFKDDIKNISKGQSVSNQLKRLNPFLDKDDSLRVGGRLHKSLLPFDSKHQLILPKRHDLTNLIIDNAHLTLLHAGPQSVQYHLLQNYWILSSRDIIRKRLFHCVKCFRARPVRTQPTMGMLPAARVRPQRPFLKTSVDYAGPFLVRANKVRNAKVIKCYVAVFVCMSVKAIHLEIVSELTTEAFLAALRRFTSRRGLCTDIYSDCGKNFVGCNNYLKELYKFLRSDTTQNELNSKILQQGITWHFQPPYAAHFGGIHESGVKSFKHHLYRVIGTRIQTYDEMHTLLCQIEAVLNSRPLCVLSADASDPLPLTPSHFLIGGPLAAIPDVSLNDVQPDRLPRWRWVQQCVQSFWNRWSKEYLHNIQQRSKWFSDSGAPIREGSIVVICDDNAPPLQWRLARVHALHPGPDNVTRVVTLQIGDQFIKRAVVKLCPLPIE